MKKILVISHLPFSKETNVGKTLLNLFDGYPTDDLSQLYFTDSGRRADGIRYYRVTDLEVLTALYPGHNHCGSEIYPGQAEMAGILINSSSKRKPLFLLLRDFLWTIGPWYSANMRYWLQETKPDVVFLAPGYSIFAYKVAQQIALDLSIPLFVYFMEDFYNERVFSLSPFFWLRYAVFRKNIRNCIKQANAIIVLNDSLRREYEKVFSKQVSVIYNPAELVCDAVVQAHRQDRGMRFYYGGSIGFDRIEILERIGKSIAKTNKELRADDVHGASFFVCGRAKNDRIIKRLNALKAVTYGGAITEDELGRKISKADILVHVESFKPQYVAKTRRALSTKIPEYLASGKLILAVGPSEIESIQYLSRNNAAVTVTDLSMLDETVSTILRNNWDTSSYQYNARILAIRNHDIKMNQEKLYHLLAGDNNASH